MREEEKAMRKVAVVLCAMFVLGSCRASRIDDRIAFKDSEKKMVLSRAEFRGLEGWREDDPRPALEALRKSCVKMVAESDFVASSQLVVSAGFVRDACAAIPPAPTAAGARAYFEEWFAPYKVASLDGGSTGKITGYYEAELEGALEKTKEYLVPIYARPDDLTEDEPYLTRREIEEQGLGRRARPLFWARRASDVHVLQIQGSGRVKTPDGKSYRVGYAGSNGRQFKGIGSILQSHDIDVGGSYSMVNVKRWLDKNPAAARKYMHMNERYIFFRDIPGDGPVGAQGVPLTPGRSVAVDNDYIPLGLPLFLQTQDPDGVVINRLVVAQDIGSAIKGVVRADLFFGFGAEAFAKAGRMHSDGTYYLLLPKNGEKKLFAVKK